MADDKQIDFVDGTTAVIAAWLDRMQEVQQGLAWNFNLGVSGTSVVLTAGSLENVASLIIKGKMRYVTAPLSVNLASQAAGTYGIWANTTSDDSDPTFTLQYVAGTSAPVGITYTRKVATVYWSGSALQDLTILAPYTKHSFMHRYGGPDALPSGSVGPEQVRQGAIGTGAYAANSIPAVAFQDEILLRPQLVWTYSFNGGYGVPTGGFDIPGVHIQANSIPLAGYRRQMQLGVIYDSMVTSGTLTDYLFRVLVGSSSIGYSTNELIGFAAGSGVGMSEGRGSWYTSYITTKNGVSTENLPMIGNVVADLTYSGGSAIASIYQINIYLRYVRI